MTVFKVGDHVEWNSEAGRVRGTVTRKVTAPMEFRGYTVHASKEEPQYLIKSDKTDHLAMHKGSALKRSKRCQGESHFVGQPPDYPALRDLPGRDFAGFWGGKEPRFGGTVLA